MNPSEQQILFYSTLLQLENQARNAKNKTELIFIIANETVRLVKYHQAIVWQTGLRGTPVIKTVSGVDNPDKTSPYINFCNKLLKSIHKASNQPQIIDQQNLPESLKKGVQEWGMGSLLHCPLTAPNGHKLGGILFKRDTKWQEAEVSLITRLVEAYAHALSALEGKRSSTFSFLKHFPKRFLQIIMLLAVILLMDQPVRLSVLAPVEIIPFEPLLVTSPLPSVIDQIYVSPNQSVEKGDSLLRLDDTTTSNQYKVSQKALAVMETEFKREKQKSFANPQSRAILLNLQASIEQKKAEITYIKDLLDRSEIFAEQSGLAVFSDVNDWLGKPVVVGEKIMTIADPSKIEAEIMLPVADAINLNRGADVLIFLNVKPDQPLKASLRRASFEAKVTADGILAFTLKATLSSELQSLPRLGLRGTAKIYGEEVSLFFYLMRKPLIAARQVVGI